MKVVVFGAGKYGTYYYYNYVSKNCPDVEIVCFLDNHKAGEKITLDDRDYNIFAVQEICNIKYDLIMIAVDNFTTAYEMKKQLIDLGIFEECIEILIEKRDLLLEIFCKKTEIKEDDKRVNWLKNFAMYIGDKKGSVAECGVFRGDFAYYINKYFNNCKLYLFDTFQGFNSLDIKQERLLNDDVFINGRYNKVMFEFTSEELVRRKMPFPEMVEFKTGYFPETAKGVEDQFLFVNLDMDLYKPMLAGLKFFYPRMEKGGVILCHDYFREDLPGVRRAICEFEECLIENIKKIPIGDYCSIAIIK